jgi:hypothetical protein
MEKAIAAAGSLTAWAGKVGISLSYASDIRAGRREYSDAVLAALGLCRIVRYAELRKPVGAPQS